MERAYPGTSEPYVITQRLELKLGSGMVMHACNPSTWEVETGAPRHPQLHSKFEASFGYIRLSQKIKLATEELRLVLKLRTIHFC